MENTPVFPVALVTGGSRGLGLLIARELMPRGYRVAVCARTKDDLERAVDELSEMGVARGYVCDVGDTEAVAAMVGDIEADLGPIDVLFNVAGIIQMAPSESVTIEHFRSSIDSMIWGLINTTWAVLPGMRERRRGAIGNITSLGGFVAPPHMLPYTTAKFGAVGFSDGLAAELAGTGVTATTIVPGMLRTGSQERALFAGPVEKQFALFSAAATLPVMSMDAARAARIIVRGVLSGRPLVFVGWMPRVAARVRGLFPGLTTRAMGLMGRLMPQTKPGQNETVEGRVARERLDSPIVDAVTTLGLRAAERNNQLG